jgi:hypothetical protein
LTPLSDPQAQSDRTGSVIYAAMAYW